MGYGRLLALSVLEKDSSLRIVPQAVTQDLITIKCSYSNGSEKDIRALLARSFFQDLFGKEIFRANITISDPIVVGQQSTWVGTIKYKPIYGCPSTYPDYRTEGPDGSLGPGFDPVR